MFYRMEVYSKTHARWLGYYNGLACIGEEISPNQRRSFARDMLRLGCSLHRPSWKMVTLLPADSYTFWATARGWRMMVTDIAFAKRMATKYSIEWRVLEIENPGEILWQDVGQAMVRNP